ncbi:hypothetical protein [Catellatospora sp. NPDC049111]|jgi:cell division septum initiation protein DivIVA|uniref:hypothetical protein n=1 Tax=unclassified Catellatospora TaxID=2645785 RepID=UPI0033FE3DDC
MTDNRLKGRVKGLFSGPAENEPIEQQASVLADPDAERQALQVLVLARRTADEHVATAQAEADRIKGDARAKADDLARDARGIVESARQDAAQIQAAAQARSVEINREAQANADTARRETEQMIAEARSTATKIVEAAQAKADELERDALQQYEDVVGSLENKRSVLQRRIEALQNFDRDYRARLRKFMNSQLDALDLDEHPAPEGDDELAEVAAGPEHKQPAVVRRQPAAVVVPQERRRP